MVRYAAAAALVAGANVAMLGSAIAPAVAHSGADGRHELGLAPVAAVRQLPVPIIAPYCQALETVLRRHGEVEVAAAPELQGDRTAGAAAGSSAATAAAPESDEIVEFGAMRIPRSIVETIVRAAAVTDVDPVYMMALADKESSFSPDVKARTSSAEGLFQFIAKTWLSMVRTYGARHGLADEAAAIELVDGQPVIKDDATRERVLGLRRDPYLSAIMAAEMLKRDRAAIERKLGRELSRSEFYLAHFLGAEGAGKLMALVEQKPKESAPRVFKDAAKANKSLFFAKDGKRTKDLTVAQVYGKIDEMIHRRITRYASVEQMIVSDLSLDGDQ